MGRFCQAGVYPRQAHCDPVRWVRRDLNVAADFLCLLAMQKKGNIEKISETAIVDFMSKEACCFQFHSDGSYTPSVGGAYAFTVFAWVQTTDAWNQYLLGQKAVFSESISSAFHAEVLGLSAATSFFEQALQIRSNQAV